MYKCAQPRGRRATTSMVSGNLGSESDVGRSYMDSTRMIGVTGMHSDIMDAVNNSRLYIICPHSVHGLIGCGYNDA